MTLFLNCQNSNIIKIGVMQIRQDSGYGDIVEKEPVYRSLAQLLDFEKTVEKRCAIVKTSAV